jgi:hypothetical protein
VSYPGKLGKKIPPEGQQVVWSSVALTSSGLTAMIMPANGQSGQAAIPAGGAGALFSDIYGVNLTSNDTTIQAVTLSDGFNSITWQVGTSPVNDAPPTPHRFRAGQPLFVSAGAVTAAKSINIQMRGVVTRT